MENTLDLLQPTELKVNRKINPGEILRLVSKRAITSGMECVHVPIQNVIATKRNYLPSTEEHGLPRWNVTHDVLDIRSAWPYATQGMFFPFQVKKEKTFQIVEGEIVDLDGARTVKDLLESLLDEVNDSIVEMVLESAQYHPTTYALGWDLNDAVETGILRITSETRHKIPRTPAILIRDQIYSVVRTLIEQGRLKGDVLERGHVQLVEGFRAVLSHDLRRRVDAVAGDFGNHSNVITEDRLLLYAYRRPDNTVTVGIRASVSGWSRREGFQSFSIEQLWKGKHK